MQDGEVNKVGLDASNQQADKIMNVGSNQGDIIVTNIYHQNNEKKIDIKPTNKFLCRHLIEALEEFSPRAKSFLKKDIALLDDHEVETWENNDSCLKKAKGIIISSFASVLGVFLSNLIASEKQKEYFELGITMAKRMLQLLCYSFVSSYWDLAKQRKFALTPEQLKQYRRFFYAGVEPSITFYADFLKTLVNIFKHHQLDYPIIEIKATEEEFAENGSFLAICKSLDAYRAQFEKEDSLPPIDEFEKVITSFLVSLKFMANYKMVSIKNIGYEATRNREPQFVHACNILGLNNANNGNGEKYMFQDQPISTDSVILYRDKYIDGLNLFPFIIDINALKDEDLARIYFYSCNDENEKTITFFETYKTSSEEKNAPDVIIEFNKEFENIAKDIIEIQGREDKDITDWMKEKGKKYKTVKLFEVYQAFQYSKECIFGKEDA